MSRTVAAIATIVVAALILALLTLLAAQDTPARQPAPVLTAVR